MRSYTKKRPLALLLMIASIGLLLAFQYVWVGKVFREQYDLLEKQAGQLFKEALFDLQDTIIRRKFEGPLKGTDLLPNIALGGYDSTKIEISRLRSTNTPSLLFRRDSIKLSEKHEPSRQSTVSIYVSDKESKAESHFDQRLSMVVLNAQRFSNDTLQEFKITLGNDSLKLEDLRMAFQKKLQKAALPLTFNVFREETGAAPQEKNGSIFIPSIPAGFPPHRSYGAEIMAFKGYLWQKIMPQLFFSLFLVGLTTLSFAFIYRSLRQQERLTALKNDFISNVTHELKTPIATVSVAIEALRDFNGLQNPQLTKEYLDISKNELNRLSILVDKVLKMAIFEQKELQLQYEQINLAALLQDVLASMRLQFEQCGAEVNLIQETGDFYLPGDRNHLISVAYNLIDNALKYSQEQPKIDIELKHTDKDLVLMVRDNGIGIAPAHQQRIFERFYRVPSGDVHDVKGHGLGLSYVADVIQKHGGRIEVLSAPGQGSCFTVYLPKHNGEAH